MTTLQEKIAIMQAFERGEKIQWKIAGGSENNWIIDDDPCWNCAGFNYRIAPKPKKTVELYQWLCRDGKEYYVGAHVEARPFRAIRRLDETRMVVEVEE